MKSLILFYLVFILYLPTEARGRFEGGAKAWNYTDSLCYEPSEEHDDFTISHEKNCSDIKKVGDETIRQSLVDLCVESGQCDEGMNSRTRSTPFERGELEGTVFEDLARFGVRYSHSQIPIQCIASSMMKGRNINSGEGSKERFACDSDEGPAKWKEYSRCVSMDLVRYTHWAVNQGIRCFSSDSQPLNPREVFSLINHESRFHPDVSSARGSGIMQIIPITIKDMLTPNDGIGRIWEGLKDSPQCQDFKAAMDSAVRGRGEKIKWLCNYLGPEQGMLRSIAIGLAKYRRVLDKSMEILSRETAKKYLGSRADYNDAILRLARMGYNRGEGDLARFGGAWIAKNAGKITYPSAEAFAKDVAKAIGVGIGEPEWDFSSLIDSHYKEITKENYEARRNRELFRDINEYVSVEGGLDLIESFDLPGLKPEGFDRAFFDLGIQASRHEPRAPQIEAFRRKFRAMIQKEMPPGKTVSDSFVDKIFRHMLKTHETTEFFEDSSLEEIDRARWGFDADGNRVPVRYDFNYWEC